MRYIWLTIFFLTTPIIAKADVIFNEVAWMGTEVSFSDEWIELYNNGTDEINLDGWTIEAEDDTPFIELSGTISAGGYYLLERTDDSTVPSETADLIYVGALADEGEVLSIHDNSGFNVDEIDGSSGWPAGDKDLNLTMSWTGSSWVSAEPTPKEQNSGQEETNDDSEVDDETEEEDTKKQGGSSSDNVQKDRVYGPSVRIEAPTSWPTGAPFDFAVFVISTDGKEKSRAPVRIFMGDGYVLDTSKSHDLSYEYTYAGDYVIVVEYLPFPESGSQATESHKIKIIDPEVSISLTDDGKGFLLLNESKKEIDLSGWKIKRSGEVFVIPEHFVLSSGKSLVIPIKNTNLPKMGDPVLLDPMNGQVSKKKVSSATSSSAYNYSNKDEVPGFRFIGEDGSGGKLELRERLKAESVTAFSGDGQSGKQKSPIVYIGLVFFVASLATVGFLYFKKREEKSDVKKLADAFTIEEG